MHSIYVKCFRQLCHFLVYCHDSMDVLGFPGYFYFLCFYPKKGSYSYLMKPFKIEMSCKKCIQLKENSIGHRAKHHICNSLWGKKWNRTIADFQLVEILFHVIKRQILTIFEKKKIGRS